MAVTCKHCGHDNRVVAVYCGNCGRAVTGELECPVCQAVNPADQNFCNNCGSRLSGQLAAHSHVTQTAADIQGTPTSRPTASTPREPRTETGVSYELRSFRPASTFEQFAFTGTVTQGIVVAAFAAAGFIRFFALDLTPAGLIAAEDAFFRVADQIKADGWIGLSHDLLVDAPTGYAYLLAAWTGVVGEGAGAARLISAIAAFASVGLFYLFASRLFSGRAALFGALLMAVGLWSLTYGRLALPVSLVLLTEMAAMYLFFRASGRQVRQPQRIRLLVASGAVVGLSVYLHSAALVLVSVMLALWAMDYLSDTPSVDVLGRRFVAFLVPVILVGLPYWTALVSTEPMEDVKSIVITETVAYRDSDGVMSKLRYVTGNVLNTGRSLVWSRGADEFGRGGGRVVDPFTGVLVAIGLLIGISRWRDRRYAAMLVLFGASVVGVGLTREEGMFGRLIIALPAVFAFAGVALDWLLIWMKGRVTLLGTTGFLAVLGLLIVFYNLSTYYAHPSGKDQVQWTKPIVEGRATHGVLVSRLYYE